jgi:hypothetical protein
MREVPVAAGPSVPLSLIAEYGFGMLFMAVVRPGGDLCHCVNDTALKDPFYVHNALGRHVVLLRKRDLDRGKKEDFLMFARRYVNLMTGHMEKETMFVRHRGPDAL